MSDTSASSDSTPLPAITDAEIIAFDTLSGRRPTTPEQRALMLPTLTRIREQLSAIRSHPWANGEAALHFAPSLTPAPTVAVPVSSSSLRPTPVHDTPEVDVDNLEALAFQSVRVLSHLIRTRRVTSTALTKMYIERLRRLGPKLHCVVTLTEERALVEAERADRELASGIYRGPLHGIPYGAKDNYAAAGYPTTVGATTYREQSFPYDSAAIERLTASGAVLCAKLSMGELAMGDTWFGGLTRNPWDLEKGSSGSSAGSGSAVAAGLIPFALGTETLGSIISPSKVCGTVGLRPTFGRISRYGIVPLTPTMDKAGPICRYVEDAAIVLSALHGPDTRDNAATASAPFGWNPHRDLSDLRIGIDETSFQKLRESEEAKPLVPFYESALETIQSLPGIRKPVSVSLPESDPAISAVAWLTIIAEGAATFSRLYAEGGFEQLAQQGPDNWPNLLRAGAMIAAADYWQAQQIRARLQREMARALSDVDVYITVPWFGPSLYYTNLAGQPEVITRFANDESGLPISLCFVGNLYAEESILRLAQAFEHATGGNSHWPQITP